MSLGARAFSRHSPYGPIPAQFVPFHQAKLILLKQNDAFPIAH